MRTDGYDEEEISIRVRKETEGVKEYDETPGNECEDDFITPNGSIDEHQTLEKEVEERLDPSNAKF